MNVTPTEWSMFGVYDGMTLIATPGDDFLTGQMDDLARRMRGHEFYATDLYHEIRAVQARCREAGYAEVGDTEPEWAIADFVNAVCDEIGWAHVNRWEF